MADAIVLYDYWRSTASYRLRIALNLKGLSYRRVEVNLLEGDHKTRQHLERHAQGMVPALAIDGHVLQQSLAILQYLDSRHPSPRVFPEDPLARARAEAIAHAVAMDIHPVCNVSVARTLAEWVGGDDAQKTATRQAWSHLFVGRGLDAIEGQLDPEGPYAIGETLTVADLCLIPQLYNARRAEMDLARWPKLARLEAACLALPAFDRARPEAVQAG